MGRMTKKKNTEGGILHFCLMFLPCVNKGDDNDDDDDDDDEGAGGGGRKKFAKFCLQPHLHKALPTKRTKKKRH